LSTFCTWGKLPTDKPAWIFFIFLKKILLFVPGVNYQHTTYADWEGRPAKKKNAKAEKIQKP
jgi:hypothetical protein